MRSITPRRIIQVSKIKLDQVYSNHTSDAEALILLNEAYLQLYLMITAFDEGLFLTTQALTVVNGEADLPDNLQKIRSVYYNIGSRDIVVERRSLQDRSNLDGFTASVARPTSYTIQGNKLVFDSKATPGNMTIKFIPHPVELVALDDAIQLVANEDQYLIARLCRDLAKREESDTTPWELEMQTALNSIKGLITPRDEGSLPQIRDVYGRANNNFKGPIRRRPY
jgi:hypothetical protein